LGHWGLTESNLSHLDLVICSVLTVLQEDGHWATAYYLFCTDSFTIFNYR